MIHHHRLSAVERLLWRWRRARPNFLVGWPTWFENRWSQVRGVWVRRHAGQLPDGGRPELARVCRASAAPWPILVGRERLMGLSVAGGGPLSARQAFPDPLWAPAVPK
jgi:hypothetical protein